MLKHPVESSVGLFLILAMGALILLAFKVSGFTLPRETYLITANFEDIGGLKVRAPVKLAGVPIGSVSQITLDPVTFKAIVTMKIDSRYNRIPDDSSARILTAGLLGDNYIEITPMYSQTMLSNQKQLTVTTSAISLEKLIGQLLFSIKK